MLQRWRVFICSFLPLVASQSFENSAIVRTVDLGGALVHVATTFAAKALQSDSKTYTIALSETEISKTSWLEVRIKGKDDMLPVTTRGLDEEQLVTLLEIPLVYFPSVVATCLMFNCPAL